MNITAYEPKEHVYCIKIGVLCRETPRLAILYSNHDCRTIVFLVGIEHELFHKLSAYFV